MHDQILTLAAAVPAPQAPSWLKTTAITGLFVFVIGLVVVWQGGKMTAQADKKRVSDNARTASNVGIGIVLIVLGLVGAIFPLIASTLGFFTPYGG